MLALIAPLLQFSVAPAERAIAAAATQTGTDGDIRFDYTVSETDVAPGTEVTYTYTVTNTSSVYTYYFQSLTDSAHPVDTTALDKTLSPGESTTVTVKKPISSTTVSTASVTYSRPYLFILTLYARVSLTQQVNVTTPPAAAVPFTCGVGFQWISQNDVVSTSTPWYPTQLNMLYPGESAFRKIGTPGLVTYNGVVYAVQHNAIGYNKSDGFLYSVSGVDNSPNAFNSGTGTSRIHGTGVWKDPATGITYPILPHGHLLQIDANGTVRDLGPISAAPGVVSPPATLQQPLKDPSWAGATWLQVFLSKTNSGTFVDGKYYVQSGRQYSTYNNMMYGVDGIPDSERYIYEIDIAARTIKPVTSTPITALIPDITERGGLLWGIENKTNNLVSYNLTTGATNRYPLPAPFPSLADSQTNNYQYGSAWTFPNGDLGFSENGTGTRPSIGAFQVVFDLDASGAPINVAVVAHPNFPGSQNNDGAACQSPPVDLGIEKIAMESAKPGDTVAWTLRVTNTNETGNSSGAVITDTIPAHFTGVASADPRCTVVGNEVTCRSAVLTPGQSTDFRITAKVPSGTASQCIVNSTKVRGNEIDSNVANDTSSAETCIVNTTIDVAKQADDPKQVPAPDANGVRTSTYTITVTNTGAGVGTYTKLRDYPLLPDGATVTSFQWSGGPSGAPLSQPVTSTVDPATGIAAYEFGAATTPIAGATGGTPVVHTYTITVKYTLDASLLAPAAEGGLQACADSNETSPGAMWNFAAVKEETESIDNNDACIDPPKLGAVEVMKVLDDPAGAFTGTADTKFPIDYVCTYPSGFAARTGTVELAVGETAKLANLESGVSCTFTEEKPTGNVRTTADTWAAPTYTDSPTVVASAASPTPKVTVGNRITTQTTTLRLVKETTGATDGIVPGTAYPVNYSCTAQAAPGYTGTIAPIAGQVQVTPGTPSEVTGLPVGASCEIWESPLDQSTLTGEGFAWGTPNYQVGVMGAQELLEPNAEGKIVVALGTAAGGYTHVVVSNPVVPIAGITKTAAGEGVRHLVDGIWDGTFDVTYDLTVTNPSKTAPLQYTLTDTPAFPSGVTINSVTATGPGAETYTGDLVGLQTHLAAERKLAAGATATVKLVLNVTGSTGGVPAPATPEECVAPDADGTGAMHNTAAVTSNGATRSDDDCASLPKMPTFAVRKENASGPQGASVVRNPDGSYTASYRVTVTNTSDVAGPVIAQVADTVTLPASADIIGITVTEQGVADRAIDGAAAATSSHSFVLAQAYTGPELAPAGTRTFGVQVTFTVSTAEPFDDTVYTDTTDVSATEPKALYNLVSMEGDTDGPDNDYAYQTASPKLRIEKTITQNGALAHQPGMTALTLFTVDYTITVTNDGILAQSTGPITDALDYAPGLVIEKVWASGTVAELGTDAALASPTPVNGGEFTLSQGVLVAPGGTATFHVRTQVRLDTAATDYDETQLACAAATDGGYTAGQGLFNEVRIAAERDSDGSANNTACGPVNPDAGKRIISVLKVGTQPETTGGLAGAEFALYNTDPASPGAQPIAGGIAIDPQNGALFTSAPLTINRDYWLVETKAPTGHTLLAQPIRFTLGEKDIVLHDMQGLGDSVRVEVSGEVAYRLTVTDLQVGTLPLTGGQGPITEIVLASLALAAAGLLSALRHRARRTSTNRPE